jgi:hypothetical protein
MLYFLLLLVTGLSAGCVDYLFDDEQCVRAGCLFCYHNNSRGECMSLTFYEGKVCNQSCYDAILFKLRDDTFLTVFFYTLIFFMLASFIGVSVFASYIIFKAGKCPGQSRSDDKSSVF